ncbi:hypothetical protein O6H91_20G053700 [Diphasiastrum complanatum]|uniref:Uncharacterized protein n=1 Tax=Diphasiastrum complanatum TaxID=34168 RepID=A0ACC2AQD6_DIPCM|nr:hypothetical protein O6H91_20G053700 [Diphasiastrum complanatum]
MKNSPKNSMNWVGSFPLLPLLPYLLAQLLVRLYVFSMEWTCCLSAIKMTSSPADIFLWLGINYSLFLSFTSCQLSCCSSTKNLSAATLVIQFMKTARTLACLQVHTDQSIQKGLAWQFSLHFF